MISILTKKTYNYYKIYFSTKTHNNLIKFFSVLPR